MAQLAEAANEYKNWGGRIEGTTIHFDFGANSFHSDTTNPYPLWEFWNVMIHGVVDVLGGHVWDRDGILR